MRRGIKYALKSLCCLVVLDFFAIFGLIFSVRDPDIFNPIMNWFVGALGSIGTLALGIVLGDCCCPSKKTTNNPSDVDLGAETSPPAQLAAPAHSQTYKYLCVSQSRAISGAELEDTELSPTSKIKVSV